VHSYRVERAGPAGERKGKDKWGRGGLGHIEERVQGQRLGRVGAGGLYRPGIVKNKVMQGNQNRQTAQNAVSFVRVVFKWENVFFSLPPTISNV